MITSMILGSLYRYGRAYLVLFTIPNQEAETAAIFNAKDVGRTGPRVQQATIYFANPFILLLYFILYCRTFVF